MQNQVKMQKLEESVETVKEKRDWKKIYSRILQQMAVQLAKTEQGKILQAKILR